MSPRLAAVNDPGGVLHADDAVPADLDSALTGLTAMLTDPDPRLRDDHAYSVLATWIDRGDLDDRLAGLGEAMVERFGHPEVQARTFAPLILGACVERDTALAAVAGAGVLDGATVRRWRDAFTAWWLAEQDLRSWDVDLGWLHAVAHGADLAGELGASRWMTAPELADLLHVVALRMVAPTEHRYVQWEEDRLALALTTILQRPELPATEAIAWLEVVDRLFATGVPGPMPVHVANTLAVLRAVYVMADRRALPSRDAVTDAVAARLHVAFAPYPATRA